MLVTESKRNEAADMTAAKAIKDIVFSYDKSSMETLENIIQDSVQFHVIEQEMLEREYIPKEVKNFFDHNGTCLYRVSSISYKGKVLSERLVFADTSLLPRHVKKELENECTPVEELVRQLDTRKNILYQGYQPSGHILELFDGCSVESHIYPTRKYQIVSKCKCLFYICEVFHAKHIYEVMECKEKDATERTFTS
ncbi:cold-shock protein [Bacillus cytotoxicus]|uniref:cold-shock protein n=1 Tax=Bacillus cereus group TaxID=86661 RepID=UPI000B35A1A7|nr:MULTISPECIES: cold-shock protein [Bacillus cereus group]MDH2880383.1 cold-shock protein [Bacillus cytotoxicus]QTR72768.1 cold-shock protein [Bacillus cytotoxicus]QTR77933.1 cold-shock protein [Bacillus cytotoxicus]QTR82248.1 cold-shock protein [Bacillus cytotoxicus]QTR85986.1 cold-shock protein [Bacillus cytotoxicus]